jgi:hypothetical protein
MARTTITSQELADHVKRLGEEHPPIPMESVDFTVKDPDMVRERFGAVFDYLARVELEVERNVKELDAILPNAPEVDVAFYRGVWADQELQHGRILNGVKAELGLPPAQPLTEVGMPVKALGVLAHIKPIQDAARCVYYFTGASTERQAVLAYRALIERLEELGEDALLNTVVQPIKRQEPGHFAFYQMSATKIVGELLPWQLYLARQMRARTYELVGTHRDPVYQAQMGRVSEVLGFAQDPVDYAREIGRLEARLLWANANGMEFPPYVLAAIEEGRRLAAEEAAKAA